MRWKLCIHAYEISLYIDYIFDLSAKLFLYIDGNKKVSSFLQVFELVLKAPQISDPYNKIGLIKWSYKCKLVLTLGSAEVISFVTLKVAFLALLKISFWP